MELECMTREEIMDEVAEHFGFDATNDDGVYDIHAYRWQAGCYIGEGVWFCPAEVVYLIENLF